MTNGRIDQLTPKIEGNKELWMEHNRTERKKEPYRLVRGQPVRVGQSKMRSEFRVEKTKAE